MLGVSFRSHYAIRVDESQPATQSAVTSRSGRVPNLGKPLVSTPRMISSLRDTIDRSSRSPSRSAEEAVARWCHRDIQHAAEPLHQRAALACVMFHIHAIAKSTELHLHANNGSAFRDTAVSRGSRNISALSCSEVNGRNNSYSHIRYQEAAYSRRYSRAIFEGGTRGRYSRMVNPT